MHVALHFLISWIFNKICNSPFSNWRHNYCKKINNFLWFFFCNSNYFEFHEIDITWSQQQYWLMVISFSFSFCIAWRSFLYTIWQIHWGSIPSIAVFFMYIIPKKPMAHFRLVPIKCRIAATTKGSRAIVSISGDWNCWHTHFFPPFFTFNCLQINACSTKAFTVHFCI